jgi:hypothetical protein
LAPSLIPIAFTPYDIGGLTAPDQLGDLIKLTGHNVEQLFRRFNLDKDKPLPLEMTENQKFAAGIYAKFLSGFHGDHQLPPGSEHGSAKTLAYFTPIPLFHYHLLSKLNQNYMISLTIVSSNTSETVRHPLAVSISTCEWRLG